MEKQTQQIRDLTVIRTVPKVSPECDTCMKTVSGTAYQIKGIPGYMHQTCCQEIIDYTFGKGYTVK